MQNLSNVQAEKTMINKWRNNVNPTCYGIPFSGLFAYVLLIYFWNIYLFIAITILNAIYAFLYWKGYTLSGMYYRIMSKLRGNIVYSRPWWFRNNWSGK